MDDYYSTDPGPLAGAVGCSEGTIRRFDGETTRKLVCTVGGQSLEIVTYADQADLEGMLVMGVAMWGHLHVGVGNGITVMSLDRATTDAAAGALGLEVRDLPA